ncbi:MAG: class I SAM-dependent methyltransferase [Methanotrichaceae archaeon]
MIGHIKDIDWNEVWKAQMLSSRESSSGRDCAHIWESRESAERFWRMSEENRDRVDKTIWDMDITPESLVLDIGAGPGTLAIPFAKKVAYVTAIEPAEGMVSVLKEKMAEQGVGNISVVQKRWEDVNIYADLQPPYDIVIASFSLGMLDIRSAIQKMVEASSKYVYLYHFAGETSWDRQWRDLWPKLHGREYSPGPKCDVLYNVLYQMGIYPHVRTFSLQHNQRYSSLQEAVEALSPQAQIQSPEQESIFREYLGRTLKEENGSLILPGSSIRVKMWWRK